MSFDVESWGDEDATVVKPCVCEERAPLWTFVADLAVFGMLAFVLLVICLTPPVAKGDQEIAAKPGRLKKITTTLDGKKILWRMLGDADLVEDSAGKFAICLFPKPGVFQIFVVTAKADEPLTETITVKVEGDVPTPPDPGPNPPKPPTPDAFLKSLQDAWVAEASPDKAKHRDGLVEVYSYAQARIHDSGTWGTFFIAMAGKARDLEMSNSLPKVQAAIRAEASRLLPKSLNTSNAIDAADKPVAQKLFESVVAGLKTLK